MEVPEHRKWMDKRMGPDKRRVTNEFMAGVVEFIEFACAQDSYKREGKLRCPCKTCKCLKYKLVDEVKTHLCMKGFMSDYYYWTNHNEQRSAIPPMVSSNSYYGSSGVRKGFNDYEQEKSMKNKVNRPSQDGHNVHSGGSISAREHAKRMRMDMDKEPTCFELYERLHRPKGKSNEWFNEKQGKIVEMYQK